MSASARCSNCALGWAMAIHAHLRKSAASFGSLANVSGKSKPKRCANCATRLASGICTGLSRWTRRKSEASMLSHRRGGRREMTAHLVVQLLERVVFAHESVGAARQGFFKQLAVTGHARKHNDRQIGIVALKKSEQLEAIFACKVYVEYDNIKRHLIHQLHSLLTGNDAGNTKALLLKKEREHLPNGRLVIDKQNMLTHRPVCSRATSDCKPQAIGFSAARRRHRGQHQIGRRYGIRWWEEDGPAVSASRDLNEILKAISRITLLPPRRRRPAGRQGRPRQGAAVKAPGISAPGLPFWKPIRS